MYAIPSSLYREVGERLVETIGTKDFFSGHVNITYGDIDCQLICTLIVERGARASEGYNFCPITSLLPVWWEFHTYRNDEEMFNDFSFKELVEATL